MSGHTILLADDDGAIRMVLNQALTRAGYEVRPTGNMSTMWNWVTRGEGDLLITDVMMPDGNAFDIMPKIKKLRPDLPVVVMSAQNTFMTAIRANEVGAYEYLPKPFDIAEVLSVVARALADAKKPAKTAREEDEPGETMPLVGRSPAMQDIYRALARLMQTDLTVMITGESGTGKELVARALHNFGKRRNGPFVAINMAAIPRDLIEAELFGHEKGAFTGAHASRVGHFEAADGGTLFLDEIGELPLSSQVRLLRVLQEHEVTRLGASKPRRVDVRIVAATNRVLPEEVRAGRFREDVFHRIAVGILALPPLRAREGDLNLLIDALLAQVNREAISQPGFKHKKLSVSARNVLLRHIWPGNVRELHNALLRASIWVPGEEIAAEDVAEVLSLTSSGADDSILGAALGEGFSLPDLMADVARHYLERAMEQSHGNKTEAAKLLGLGSYQTLTNWLLKYQPKTSGTDGA